MNDKPLAVDLGSGPGVYLVKLLWRGFSPIGVDDYSDLNGRSSLGDSVSPCIESGEIEYHRAKAESFVVGEPSNKFSLVSIQRPSGLMALLTVPRKSDEFLNNIRRILKPDGIFELTIFEADETYYDVMKIIESKSIFELNERKRDGGLYISEYLPVNQ